MKRTIRVLGGAWLVLAVAAASGGGCSAQTRDDTGSLMTLGMGASIDFFSSRDPLVSPRAHKGSGTTPTGFVLSIKKAERMHEVELWSGTLDVAPDDGFAFSRGGNTVATPRSETQLVDAGYTYMARVRRGVWTGANVSAHASHTKYDFGASATEGFLYMMSLRLAVDLDADIGNDGTLRFGMRIPMLGWVARPTYSTVDEERLQSKLDVLHRLKKGVLTTPADLQGLSGRLTFLQAIDDRFGIRVALEAEYLRHSGMEVFESLQAGLDLGFFLQWGGGR